MNVTDDIACVGVNGHEVDLFEGQCAIPFGMAYDSCLVRDEGTPVFDTVVTVGSALNAESGAALKAFACELAK